MKKLLLFLFITVLLVGCGQEKTANEPVEEEKPQTETPAEKPNEETEQPVKEENKAPENKPAETEKTPEKAPEKPAAPAKEQLEKEQPKKEQPTIAAPASELTEYFLNNGTKASFQGEGNEYAEYKTRTVWLNDNYINVYEDNGGVNMVRTFRLDGDEVLLVREEPAEGKDYHPSNDELAKLTTKKVYLKLPLTKGASFEGWTVINDNATLQTPLRSFNHVKVLEKKHDDGDISRRYFAVGFGEIKREYQSATDNGFEVTSVIKTIE